MNLSFWKANAKSVPDDEPRHASSSVSDALLNWEAALNAAAGTTLDADAFEFDAVRVTGDQPADGDVAVGESLDGAATAPVPVATTPPATPNERSRDRALFQELLQGLYDAVIIADPEGTVIASNPRTAKLFGYSADDLWDVHCATLMPAMRPAVLAKIRAHVESGRFTMVNAACTRKDGSNFPAEIAINRINLFNAGDLIFSVRSIERRVRAMDRHSMDATMMDCMAAGMLVCETDGRIVATNPAFVRMVGEQTDAGVLHRFAGEFFLSQEAGSQALLKAPAGATHWVGRLQLRHASSHVVQSIATAARTASRKGMQHQIVLTFTPVPMRADSGSAPPA